MAKIYVTRTIPKAGMAMLHEAFGESNVAVGPEGISSRETLLEGVQGAEAIYAILTERIDDEVLEAAGPQVRVVANMAVGYNNVDVDACTARGIPVTNTPGVLTETTADLTWALLMATARRLPESERHLRSGTWEGWGPLQFIAGDVHGKTLGLFGMGRIARAVARRATGFNMRVLYTTRTPLDAAEAKELGAESVSKEELLASSDYLSVHCPLTPETTHAFGASEFKAMKNSACLINTARGPIVDEAALVDALASGDIARAGLDVFEDEPKVHPGLLDMENVCILPHIGSASTETRDKMATMAAENVIARLSGKTPPNCVNPDVL